MENSNNSNPDSHSSTCRRCRREARLTTARMRSYNWICNRCANQQRDSDVARYIARKLADSLRRQGVAKPYPGVQFVRQVIERCEGRSAFSGNANMRHLCVVKRDPEQPLVLDNAMLVTGGECYALSMSRKRKLVNENRE